MNGTAGAFLDLCRSHLGFVEGPGDNETVFGAAKGANFQPWCASFVSFCLRVSGTDHGRIVYVPAIVARYRDEDRLFTTPQPGDLMCLWFPSKGRYAHVAAVEAVDGDFVWTVEGNSNKAGSRTGGSVVRLHRRWKGTRTVFARPHFKVAPAAVAEAVTASATTASAPGHAHDEEEAMPFTLVRPQGGYIVVQPDGGVFATDPAPFRGSLPELGLVHPFPVVAGAWNPSGDGYWLLAADGALFAFAAPGITGSNVGPLKEHVGSRRICGLVATGPGSVKIIAQERPGDFDTFEVFAAG